MPVGHTAIDRGRRIDMRASQDVARLLVVTANEERGRAIQKRLDDLGLSAREFEDRTGVNRKTLGKAVAGNANTRDTTYEAIESYLDGLEARISGKGTTAPAPDDDMIELTIEGDFGVRAVVKGPIRDKAELMEMTRELIRELRSSDDNGATPE